MNKLITLLRKKVSISILIFSCVPIASTLWIVQELRAQQSALEGFGIYQVRFDESTGGKQPTPVIPNSWKFVGVSNGGKINSSSLWFQDSEGNIYRVTGFSSDYSGFILENIIDKIASKK